MGQCWWLKSCLLGQSSWLITSLPSEIQLVLFRIAQEALRNIHRHSEVSEANLVLKQQGDEFRMTISDNGKGFKPPEQLNDFATQDKLGTLGMEENESNWQTENLKSLPK